MKKQYGVQLSMTILSLELFRELFITTKDSDNIQQVCLDFFNKFADAINLPDNKTINTYCCLLLENYLLDELDEIDFIRHILLLNKAYRENKEETLHYVKMYSKRLEEKTL